MLSINTAATLLLWAHPISYLLDLVSRVVPSAKIGKFWAELNTSEKSKTVYHSIAQEILRANLHSKIIMSPHHTFIGTMILYTDLGAFVSPDLVEKDEDAFRFLCKREICHLINLDRMKNIVKMAITLNASMYIMRHFFDCSFFTTGISYLVILPLAGLFFQTRHENRADDFAIDKATINELKGGLRFIRAQENFFSLHPITYLANLIFGPYSSNQLRAEKITAALKEKGETYDPNNHEIHSLVSGFEISFNLKSTEFSWHR